MYEIYEQLCKERGLTNYKVWKATGVSQSSLSEWKKGNSMPKYESMRKISDFLGVTIDYLLGKHPKPDPSMDHQLQQAVKALSKNKELVVLCRKVESAPPDKRDQITRMLCESVDNYLRLMGIDPEQ